MTDTARERLLAKLLAERGLTTAAPPTIPIRPPGSAIPLTSAQRRLWFLDRVDENRATYLVIGTYELTGAVDADRVRAALGEVVRRHEALRSYVGEEDGEPVLRVADDVEPVWAFHDRPDQLADLITAETEQPFQMDIPPLLRATLIRLEPQRHLLILVAHHVVCDDWSLGIVLSDLITSYAGRELAALPVRFGDYACWRAAHPTDHEAYWATQLAGSPTVLELPTDRPRPPTPSGRGGAIQCGQLDLSALATETGCTPFMILVAALGAVLGRLADVDDVLIGTAITNRDAPELAGVVGMFVNTVVLRVDLSGEPTTPELLARVRGMCVDGLSHGDTLLEQVIELVNPERDASYNPLFQVMLVLNPASTASGPDGLRVEPASMGSVPARFDLTLVATQSQDGVTVQLDYATDLFTEPTAHRIADALRRVLRTMVDNPAARVWEIPLADPIPCTGGLGTDSPSVVGLIAEQVRRTPDAPAVIAYDGSLTYRELWSRANEIADHVDPHSIVGLAIPASADALVGLLGILIAGSAYLPLDPTHPAARLAAMTTDAGASVVLTSVTKDLPPITTGERHDAGPDDLAYVIYTSGSTGEPKGVAVTHGSLTNLAIAFARRHGFSQRDRLLMVPPLSFDASVGDIFPALISGAALVLPSAPGALTGPDLVRLCDDAGVTAIDTASALWQQWVSDLDAERPAAFPESLRLVMVGGERVPAEVVRRWARLSGNVELYNHYGPTEATVCATTYRTVAADEVTGDLPIGRPLPGVNAYVLDRRMRPAPPGVPGELYLGGLGVARGYLGRPGPTASRFLPDPFAESGGRMYRTGDRARYRVDGELEFLGRTDRQVKIRGNRIELGEIEAAMARHPGVREVAVVAGAGTLVAYVAGSVTGVDLRAWLGGRLPDYLVPNAIVVLEALPLTRHGKVDLKALPEPESSRPAFTAPRGAVETRMARLWAEVLKVDRVGADDDFFALGGHSLLIPKLLAAVKIELGLEISARAVLRNPRLADFAAEVDQHGAGTRAEPAALPEVPELRADARLPDDVRPGENPDRTEGSVLFTGGTGVLGARLLADVLQHTTDAVYCLVRAESEDDGAVQLRNALETRGLWRPHYATRIIPVPGDLTRPRLGLEHRRFDELSERVGMIYHSAALINLLYPYGLLRPTNVDGTLEVLRLAARGGSAVHFVSTLGVFFGEAFAGRVVTERDEPTDPTGIGSTFATSKWVADGLVREARERGVPATVYRLARVTGDSRTGESKVDDLFCRTLKTYVQLGYAPADGELDISPVDYLARAIGALSRQPVSANRDFHFRCSTALPQSGLTEAITEFGYPLEIVDTAEFWGKVAAGIGEREDLGMAPFAGVRSLPSGPGAPLIDCTDTETVLAGLGLIHPVPDAELIRRYLDYFVQVGFLPEPVRSR